MPLSSLTIKAGSVVARERESIGYFEADRVEIAPPFLLRFAISTRAPGGHGQLPAGRDRDGQSGGSRAVKALALGAHKPVGGDPPTSPTWTVAADRGPIVAQGQQHQRRDPTGMVLEAIHPRRRRRAPLPAADCVTVLERGFS